MVRVIACKGISKWSIKDVIRVVTLVSILWLSSIAIVPGKEVTIDSHKRKFMHNVADEVTIGRGKFVTSPKVDINYTSKRKVPNGPDPIHNRRTGNSRQPPGQA